MTTPADIIAVALDRELVGSPGMKAAHVLNALDAAGYTIVPKADDAYRRGYADAIGAIYEARSIGKDRWPPGHSFTPGAAPAGLPPKAERPSVCPTCGSRAPIYALKGSDCDPMTDGNPDPWHGGAEWPVRCPTCGSDDPKVCANGYMRPHQHGVLGDGCCPDPWHGGAE